jgi:LacI family transcriptional regulator
MGRRIPRVALLIESSRAYGRGLLRGVMRYLQEHGPWSVTFRPRGLGEPPPPWLTSWKGDGILVRADSRRLARAVAACGVPTVDLRLSFTDLGWPAVGIDNRTIVELATQHLIDQGFRHFGFCGLPPWHNVWADFRADCFRQTLKNAGYTTTFYPPDRRRSNSLDRDQAELAAWLTEQPKPIGIMAASDDRGLEVLEACRRARLAVPDQVGVIGVDNDEMLCGLADPPMSSVDVGVERAGYEAAALLERLMNGGRPPEEPVYLAPQGVVVRRSTEILQVQDPDLKEMIRFIREHACDSIRVEDAMAHSELSPSTLQRRFRHFLGRSPKEEMTRLRIDRARQLLAETELTMAEVGTRCGFAELKHFSRAFHHHTGATPSRYRQQQRKHGAEKL